MTEYYKPDIPHHPIIILGAARSGTNMLRDILTKLPAFGTWPCDEINYIWRHGNVSHPDDELPLQAATEPVQAYIRRSFDWVARQYQVSYVVEKTCANTLRVGFVNQVVPDARYIHIVRDGRDAVASAMKRWTASLDIPYIMSKARFVPLTDLPYYSSRYLWNRVQRKLSGEGRLAFWGPRFAGFEAVARTAPLEEVCAIQWQRCVEKATHDLHQFDPQRVCQVSYEAFVANPTAELLRIGRFLGLELREEVLHPLVQNVSPKSVGLGKKQLSPDALQRVEGILHATLSQFGYT